MPKLISGPTELELMILRVLWKAGEPLIVREIRQRLADDEQHELAHTTVVTTMHTMTKKKLVKRRQVNAKAYSFEARVQEHEVSRGMVEELLKRVFDGSPSALMLSLLDTEQVTDEEHRELRRLINRRRQKEDQA